MIGGGRIWLRKCTFDFLELDSSHSFFIDECKVDSSGDCNIV